MRPYGGSWGYISPMTPLAQADCPPDMKSGCTWGDFYAYKYAGQHGQSGAFGYVGSDFGNGQPSQQSFDFDFNPLVIGQFQNYLGHTIPFPGTGVPAMASYINSNLYPQWNDFISTGWCNLYSASRHGSTRQPANRL